MAGKAADNPSIAFSVSVYQLLLHTYPAGFQREYGPNMVQVVRDSFRDAYHHNGMPGLIGLWLHTFADLLVTVVMEHISERSQVMFSPGVVLWGGIAGVFCGLFWAMLGIAPDSGEATLVLALVLGLGGLASLYSRQAGRGGILGLAGFALGIIGTVLALISLWWSSISGSLSPATIRTEPVLAAPAVLSIALGMVTLGIGLALLGVASLLAKTLDRWRGLPLGLGLLSILQSITFWLVYYVPLSQGRNPWDTWPPAGYGFSVAALVLFGLGWMALGTLLATQAGAQLSPPPASA